MVYCPWPKSGWGKVSGARVVTVLSLEKIPLSQSTDFRRRHPLNTIEAITEILKREGVEYLPCFPTTPVIEAAALGGIRPIICRQERVGVGIADGISRVSNGDKMGVFAMQYGPGAENAYPGIATSYSDSVPILLLPLGHPRDRAGINPHYSSLKSYDDVTKAIEQVNVADRTSEVLPVSYTHLTLPTNREV